MNTNECCYCGKPPKKTNGNTEWFWILSNCFGISGKFCSDCYELVKHDAFDTPVNPDEYNKALLFFKLKNS